MNNPVETDFHQLFVWFGCLLLLVAVLDFYVDRLARKRGSERDILLAIDLLRTIEPQVALTDEHVAALDEPSGHIQWRPMNRPDVLTENQRINLVQLMFRVREFDLLPARKLNVSQSGSGLKLKPAQDLSLVLGRLELIASTYRHIAKLLGMSDVLKNKSPHT